MRKLIVILLILQLILVTVPVEAGIDHIYTAVTSITQKETEKIVPHTAYAIFFDLEVWSEKPADLRPETLGIEEDTCLVNLNITTTSDLQSRSDCLIKSESDYYYKGTNYEAGIKELRKFPTNLLIREGLHVDEFNSDGDNLPNGNITYSFDIVEPVISDIFGDMYGFTMTTINKSNTIIYDELPDNYGETSNKSSEFVHLRIKNVRPGWADPRNFTYTSFNFDIIAEILNTGPTYSHYLTNTATQYLLGNISLVGLEYELHNPGGGDMMTKKTYPNETRVKYSEVFEIRIEDQLIDVLPDGEITLWFYTMQLENNTYYASITIENGFINYEYDELPATWYNYDLVSIAELWDFTDPSNEASWSIITPILLLPIVMIYRKRMK